MQNELKKTIREAFDIAYNNYKKALNESALSLGEKLSPQEKAQADNLLDILVNKKPGYANIEWDPSGKGEGIGQYTPAGEKKARTNGNRAQQDYMIESLLELYKSTRDEKYKNALAQFFRFTGKQIRGAQGETITDESPLWKIAKKRYGGSTALERLEKKKPGTLYDFLANSWEKIFSKDYFDKLVDKYQDTGLNFGRLLSTHILTDLQNQIRDSTGPGSEFDAKVKSMDAPSNVTGKSLDFGDEDNGGEIEDDEPMNGIGATDDTYNRDEDNLYQKEKSSEYDAITADASDNQIKSKKIARIMIGKLFKSLDQGIREFIAHHEPTEAQLKGLQALNELMNGLNPQEVTKKLGFDATAAIQGLKMSKEFTRIVDDYLLANGFLNSRGKPDTFGYRWNPQTGKKEEGGIKPKYISDAAKFIHTGDTKLTDKLDDRNTNPFIDSEESNDGQELKKMIVLKNSIKRGIKDFKSSGNLSQEEQQGLNALEIILNTGANVEELMAELGYDVENSINSVSKNGEFLNKINTILKKTAENNKLSIEPVSNIDPNYLSKIANYMKTGSESSLAENLINEEFIAEHLDKIIEQVYKRLALKLNN